MKEIITPALSLEQLKVKLPSQGGPASLRGGLLVRLLTYPTGILVNPGQRFHSLGGNNFPLMGCCFCVKRVGPGKYLVPPSVQVRVCFGICF